GARRYLHSFPPSRSSALRQPDDIDTCRAALKQWKKAAAGIYRLDKARVSRRISLEFMLEQANKFASKKALWFPYNMDWRGRVY
ncbi:hypothetical protein FG476_00520, partial [Xylella fastidiosa subsp. multiplex]